eukprot:9479662-Pyramimonas_sp.AAC.1
MGPRRPLGQRAAEAGRPPGAPDGPPPPREVPTLWQRGMRGRPQTSAACPRREEVTAGASARKHWARDP